MSETGLTCDNNKTSIGYRYIRFVFIVENALATKKSFFSDMNDLPAELTVTNEIVKYRYHLPKGYFSIQAIKQLKLSSIAKVCYVATITCYIF